MTTIHLVTGDKGNVGKSAWSMAMIECYRHYERPLAIFDADHDSQTLSNVYESAFPIMLSEDIAYAPLLDSIYETARDEAKKKSKGGDVLVDLPAGGEKFINTWINDCGLTELAEEDGITIVKWWVSDADSNSIELFVKDVECYPTIQYVFLKNMGRSVPPRWTKFNEHETIQTLVEQKRIRIFDLPGIPSAILDELRVVNAKLIDVVNDKQFKTYGLSKVMRVRTWLVYTRQLIDEAMPIKKRTVRKKKKAGEQPIVEAVAESDVLAETDTATDQAEAPVAV